MKYLRCIAIGFAMALTLISPLVPKIYCQSWLDFAHPSQPHSLVGLGPIKVDGLYEGDAQVDVPILVILLEFPDPGGGGLHRPEHSTEYWEDLVFGNPRAGYDDPATPGTRPSMAQIVARSSNGRVRLVPATAGDCHGAADGVVGWIMASQNRIDVMAYSRREAIERADLFFDYYRYDTKPPYGVITQQELGILVVFSASDPNYLSDGSHHCCCCEHDPPHPNCPDCRGFAGRCVSIGNVTVDNENPPVWCPGGSGSAVTIQIPCIAAATTECADANLALHELLHEVFGLDDLYGIDLKLCNPGLPVVDGYICYNTQDTCGGKACNDTIAEAKCVEDGEVVDFFEGISAIGNTTNNTGADQSSCAMNDTIDVWYTYTPAYSEDVTASLCIPGCGDNTSKFDTTLAVFDSSGTQIPGACNDDFATCGEGDCNRLSQLTIPMTEAVRYYIRVSGYNGAVGPFNLYVSGGGGSCNYPNDDLWFPHPVGIYSDMDGVPNEYFPDLGPWVKLHLGWIKPLVVTHDGTYTLSDAETVRSFSQQTSQPEALIVYDPLRPDAYKEYFMLENRNIETLPDVVPATIKDRGMAVWLINEYQTVGRRIEWLIRRGGHRAEDSDALWDGINDVDGYDLSAISNPRNTNWTNDSPSYIEIYDISAADPVMTFKVRMPPIFVDQGNGDYENGWLDNPFNTINEGLAAIPEHPRTIKIAGGSYPETMTINAPCTLMGWRNGNVVIGQ